MWILQSSEHWEFRVVHKVLALLLLTYILIVLYKVNIITLKYTKKKLKKTNFNCWKKTTHTTPVAGRLDTVQKMSEICLRVDKKTLFIGNELLIIKLKLSRNGSVNMKAYIFGFYNSIPWHITLILVYYLQINFFLGYCFENHLHFSRFWCSMCDRTIYFARLICYTLLHQKQEECR